MGIVTKGIIAGQSAPQGGGTGGDTGDLAVVATTGRYTDLIGRPTLGTAAAEPVSAFATASQGAKADSAVQPGQLASVASSGQYSDLQGRPVRVMTATTVGDAGGILIGDAILISPGTAVAIDATVKGIRTDVFGEVGLWRIAAIAKNIGGTISIAQTFKTVVSEDDATFDVNFVSGGNEVQIVGTGNTGKTLSWTALVTVF
jgi:hypothetical protein